MSEPTEIYQLSPGEAVRVQLPHRIGYVEIRTAGVNPATGHPTIGVDVVQIWPRNPAADGRIYKAVRDRETGVVLIGHPGPEMLEKQRQVEWFERVIKKHDSGNHSECPIDCPVKAPDVPRETSKAAVNYNIQVKVKDGDGQHTTIPLDRERLHNMRLSMEGVKDARSVTYQGKIYTVQGAEIVCALAEDVPRETEED